jgi:hypothetical protein
MELVDGTLLAFLAQQSSQDASGSWSSHQLLEVVDLSNPDAPSLAGSVDLGSTWAWGLRADGRRVYLTHAEYLPQPSPNDPQIVRNYMDRIDLTDPKNPARLPSVNIPGVLQAVSDGGRRIYTVDYQWSGTNPVNTFDALTVDGDVAYLDGALSVPAQIGDVRVASGRAYFTTQDWWWLNTNGTTSVSTTLRTLDVSDPAHMAEVSKQTLSGAYSLREATSSHLFLETGGWWWWGAYGGVSDGVGIARPGIACIDYCGGGGTDSLAVFDLVDPSKPGFVSATRLNGWLLSLASDATTAYLPSGYYGVQTVPLAP